MACESATVRRTALHSSRRAPFTQLFRPRDVFPPLAEATATRRASGAFGRIRPPGAAVPRPSLTAAARWVLAASHSASHAAQKLPMPFSPSVLGKPAGSDRNHA